MSYRHSHHLSHYQLALGVFLSLFTLPLCAQPTQTELDAEFEELMNGAQLQGHFTINGMDIPIQPESYSLSSVEKQEDGKWLFTAAMKYMNTEVTLPCHSRWSGRGTRQ